MNSFRNWFWSILCVLFLAFHGYVEISDLFLIGPVLKMMMAGIFCLLLTLAVHPWQSKRRGKIWFALLFVYYLWMLANLLFFDSAFGRGSVQGGVNLEPLHTIHNYLRAYELGNIRLKLVAINLLGNLIAFAPMAVFLPALFRSQNNLLVFLITILLLVIGVESVQYFTHTGSCDIDDLILNTAGAVAVWILLLPWRLFVRYKER